MADSDDDSLVPGRARRSADLPKDESDWTDLLQYLGGSAALTVVPVLYILVTGAPWNGRAAVLALIMGGTTLLLAVATAVWYLLDRV